jgi:hypothetical protein
MIKTYLLAASAALLLSAPALAGHHGHKSPESGPVQATKIMIKGPWARASIGRNGAAFLTIVNEGKTDDMLVRVGSAVAKRVRLHSHKMDGNIMRMRALDHVRVPAGATVTLKPGGHHVMLMGLTSKLKEGGAFLLTLEFRNAGRMQVTVKIGKMGAMGSAPDHSGQKMKH